MQLEPEHFLFRDVLQRAEFTGHSYMGLCAEIPEKDTNTKAEHNSHNYLAIFL